jgi:hypothetical protein
VQREDENSGRYSDDSYNKIMAATPKAEQIQRSYEEAQKTPLDPKLNQELEKAQSALKSCQANIVTEEVNGYKGVLPKEVTEAVKGPAK